MEQLSVCVCWIETRTWAKKIFFCSFCYFSCCCFLNYLFFSPIFVYFGYSQVTLLLETVAWEGQKEDLNCFFPTSFLGQPSIGFDNVGIANKHIFLRAQVLSLAVCCFAFGIDTRGMAGWYLDSVSKAECLPNNNNNSNKPSITKFLYCAWEGLKFSKAIWPGIQKPKV